MSSSRLRGGTENRHPEKKGGTRVSVVCLTGHTSELIVILTFLSHVHAGENKFKHNYNETSETKQPYYLVRD